MISVRRVFTGAAVVLLVSLSGFAQAPSTAPTLNKEEKLQLLNYAKDYRLAEQQIALIKVQLAASLVSERQSAIEFNTYLAKLRTRLNAPADKWDFDGRTLSFVPHTGKAPAVASVPVKPAKKK